MNPRATLLLTASLALLPACAAPTVLVDARSGIEVTTEESAIQLARCDVVFLGELHDSGPGHSAQLELVQLLHERRPDLIVSMEMFERDVQDRLDAYLAGEIDEETFLAESRPWRTYREFYRPVVEYARSQGLPVIAANTPRDLARKARVEGLEALAGSPHVAAEVSTPRDGYFERFGEAMESAELSEDELFAYYVAQCVKDDTMAESIVLALEAARADGAEWPLVVHLCGAFHSDFRQGTVARVVSRDPGLQTAVVSMERMDVPSLMGVEVGTGRAADYVLAVPQSDAPPAPPRSHPKAEASPHSPHRAGEEGVAAGAAAEGGAAHPAATEEAVVIESAELEPGARPALGFMPEYQGGEGVPVAQLREGGPAEQAGMQTGDVVVQVAGEPVLDIESYMGVLQQLEIGETVEVVVMRGSDEKRLRVQVGSR